MLKPVISLLTAIAVFAALFSAGIAQTSDLQLVMSKSMGFALGSQIQGQFNLGVAGPSGITSVTYEIDGKEMATVTQPPFRYSFSTDSYSLGQHQFTATARTSGGQTLKSNVINAEIVSASAGWQASGRTILPVLGVVLLIVIVIVAVQVVPIGNRRRYQPGQGRSYGALGGAICKHCGRPFARSFFGLNLIGSKLERCPYCGTWQLTRPASREALDAAEKSEIQGSAPIVQELTPEERLRQQIDESKLAR